MMPTISAAADWTPTPSITAAPRTGETTEESAKEEKNAPKATKCRQHGLENARKHVAVHRARANDNARHFESRRKLNLRARKTRKKGRGRGAERHEIMTTQTEWEEDRRHDHGFDAMGKIYCSASVVTADTWRQSLDRHSAANSARSLDPFNDKLPLHRK